MSAQHAGNAGFAITGAKRKPLQSGEEFPRGESNPCCRTENPATGAKIPAKTAVSEAGGAFGGALETGKPHGDPDLALIVGQWAALPEALKAGIVAMVKAVR